MITKQIIFSLLCLLSQPVLRAQMNRSQNIKDSIAVYPPGCYQKMNIKKFIGPVILIAYGYAATKSDALFSVSQSVQKWVWTDHPHKTTQIDNYLQWAPAAAVYALNFAGIKGEHNFVDRTMIFGISNLIMESFVSIIKNNSHEIRPDSSDYYSFPSGHTAEAFLSATFLMEEYRNVSIWYGIGGYVVAGTVGYLRVYNNKHWLHDVVGGAGFGIASAELAYWLYPVLKRTFFPKSCGKKMIVPVAEEHGLGLAYIQQL
jgi:membrane-associated phospholipid phosphatase